MASIARITRSSMLEVIRQDYIRTARAKGVSEKNVITKHALKNALIPTITVVGLQIGAMLGGSVMTESVFAWPGIGPSDGSVDQQRDITYGSGMRYHVLGELLHHQPYSRYPLRLC